MKQDKTKVFNMDCMEYMQSIPENYFELAIVDPEFGIGIGKSPRLVTDKGKKAKKWDDKPISMNYFDNLYRISKNQIIWGGNYYALPANKHCIIWDKMQPEDLSFGMFDYAWTSFNGSNKIFRRSVQLEKDKIHPTQKPVKLYEWLLMNYAKEGDKILDTHLGSQSSRIAAYNLGFEFVGTELDQEYFEQGCNRFDNQKKQLTLF
jgi:site-specific DNA-methyltransferase (adenine-specific)